MIFFIHFVIAVWDAWRRARKSSDPTCTCVIRHGVPAIAVFIGLNLQAWRVMDLAQNCILPDESKGVAINE